MIRAYLRASTDKQDALRAKQEIKEFVNGFGKKVAGYYVENISGTKLERPELSRLIEDSEKDDILLVEKLDRLTRLPYESWKTLQRQLEERGIQIVVIDNQMTHKAFSNDVQDSFITKALTAFMLDLAAGMARDDYETRAKRQKQGIEKAKANGKYKGRKKDDAKREKVRELLKLGQTYTFIQETVGCSPYLVQQVSRELKKDNK
jgi:DNA invertase Pin-like site-specific DNA recombinase